MHFRPKFNRKDVFVNVKPIRLTAKKTIPPGTALTTKDHKMFQLIGWYNRSTIGKEGCEWVNARLGALKEKEEDLKVSRAQAKADAEKIEELPEATIEDASKIEELPIVEDEAPVEPVKAPATKKVSKSKANVSTAKVAPWEKK
jgi:hypothetical protein